MTLHSVLHCVCCWIVWKIETWWNTLKYSCMYNSSVKRLCWSLKLYFHCFLWAVLALFFPKKILTLIYFTHIEFWINVLIFSLSVHKCTSAEKMFASRNTDGNETSRSEINKRWSERPVNLIEYSNFQVHSNQSIPYLPRAVYGLRHTIS